MQKALAATIFGITVLDSLLGYLCVHAAHHTYMFAIFFVVTTVICASAGINALDRNTPAARTAQNGFVLLSFVFLIVAVAHWPGDEDGPGMILAWVIGPTLLVAVILAIISTISLLRSRRGKGNKDTI
jgi:hypothetical protein